MTLAPLLLGLLLMSWPNRSASQVRPQYVLFTDCPYAGGYPFTGNLSADAASLRVLPDAIGTIRSADGHLTIGCEFPFSLMQDEVPMAEKERRLRALLAASVESRVPVSVVCECTSRPANAH